MLKLSVIILSFLVLDIKGHCQITRALVENTNRIFTYRYRDGSYQFVRTEIVPNGDTVHLVCTPRDVVQMKCQGNQFKSIPKRPCTKLMIPTIHWGRDLSCPAHMASVGYAFNNQHLEIFRACYDVNTARAIFAESDIYYRTFYAKRPMVNFLSDGLQTMGASYIKNNIYNAFCSILNYCKQYICGDKKLEINRGHLVASADFLFVDQMISTYRYINVVPQFKSINEGNWQKIESWVRSQVPTSGFYRVKTGGIDVLALRDGYKRAQHIYLAGRILPVPQWIYKSVRDNKNRKLYVFLIFNSICDQGIPRAHESCKPVRCPVTYPNNAVDGYYYCCDPATFPY